MLKNRKTPKPEQIKPLKTPKAQGDDELASLQSIQPVFCPCAGEWQGHTATGTHSGENHLCPKLLRAEAVCGGGETALLLAYQQPPGQQAQRCFTSSLLLQHPSPHHSAACSEGTHAMSHRCLPSRRGLRLPSSPHGLHARSPPLLLPFKSC